MTKFRGEADGRRFKIKIIMGFKDSIYGRVGDGQVQSVIGLVNQNYPVTISKNKFEGNSGTNGVLFITTESEGSLKLKGNGSKY